MGSGHKIGSVSSLLFIRAFWAAVPWSAIPMPAPINIMPKKNRIRLVKNRINPQGWAFSSFVVRLLNNQLFKVKVDIKIHSFTTT